MKIAFVITGSNTTSIYIVTQDIISYLRGKGHQVDVFLTELSHQPLDSHQKYINRKNIFKSKIKNSFFRLLKNLIGRHVFEFLTSHFIVEKNTHLFQNYDCIFVHGAVSINFRCLKLPHYVVLHSCKYENFLSRRSWLTKPFYKRLYQLVYNKKNLLTVSNSASDDITERMGVKPNSIETIYNGFDFDRLVGKAKKGKTENVPESFIMAAGRPDHTKRFDILLKAYAKTKKNLPLVIFGEGRKLNELKKLAINLRIQDKVIFWGFCDNLLPYFKQASLYILSSDVEGLPTVIIESIAIGTPVVATDVGGVREILGDRLQHCIVPRRDVDTLARKIDEVLDDLPKVSVEDINFLDYRSIGKRYEELSERMRDGL